MDRPAPADLPQDVEQILATLWSNGHAAYLVGGGVRDALLGRPVTDWDIATDARPERILEVFPTGRYENKFGTVTVPARAPGGGVQVTTFRRDHQYADHRRPDSVTFTDSLSEDLARRDFTVNAIAWGRPAEESANAHWVDPTEGIPDVQARLIRAVGEPAQRFDEDALRLLRAARLAAQLSFDIEPLTHAAMADAAAGVRWVSSERIGAELRKMVAADPPSAGFAILAETGVLGHALPELAAQRGVPQDKATGHDLWGHCMATVDAAAALGGDETLRLAALMHDIGKPPTFADGHFIGHDTEGARMAHDVLARLAYPRHEADHVAELIRHHMFAYERQWSNAAVRRFIRRVGRDLVDDLIMLRRADNIGSGLPANAGFLDELAERVGSELAAGSPLSLRELAVDGNDLVQGLGIAPGPQVGELLERLLGSVIADPSRNTRERLLTEARTWANTHGSDART